MYFAVLTVLTKLHCNCAFSSLGLMVFSLKAALCVIYNSALGQTVQTLQPKSRETGLIGELCVLHWESLNATFDQTPE